MYPNQEKKKPKFAAQIICWRCKKAESSLRRCEDYIDKKGKHSKSIDYICNQCLPIFGEKNPNIGNQSHKKLI